jgi:hypothetical protein
MITNSVYFHDSYICLLTILLTLQLNYWYSNFPCLFFSNSIESSPFSCFYIIAYVSINAIWPSSVATLFRARVPYQTSHFEINNLACILLFKNRFSFSERLSFHLYVIWVLELCTKKNSGIAFFIVHVSSIAYVKTTILVFCIYLPIRSERHIIAKKIQELPSLYYHNFSLFTRIEFCAC